MAFLGIMSGCASIVDGSKQLINIQSSHSDAEVSINGVSIGKTPLSIEIKRANGTKMTIRKEGFKEIEITMPTKLNGTFRGNFLVVGLPGSTTDAVSGASREYAPNSHVFNLEPLN